MIKKRAIEPSTRDDDDAAVRIYAAWFTGGKQAIEDEAKIVARAPNVSSMCCTAAAIAVATAAVATAVAAKLRSARLVNCQQKKKQKSEKDELANKSLVSRLQPIARIFRS